MPQESVLAPLLYSIFIDDLTEALQAAAPGLPLSHLIVHGILYADDIAAVARNPEELQRLMEAAEAHSLANGHRFNVGKCQIVAIPEPEAAPTLYAAPSQTAPPSSTWACRQA